MKRDSNIELLRIYSMVLIIINHIINLGVLAKTPEQETLLWVYGGPVNKMLAAIFTSCGRVGVAVFFMIPGYFMISRDAQSTKPFWILIKKIYYYGLTMFLIFVTVHAATGYYEDFRLKSLVRRSVFLAPTMWWFASSYLVLLIIMPWLNITVMELQEKRLLLPFLIFIWFFFYRNGTSLSYYNIVRATFFYLLGAVIRLWEDKIPKAAVLYLLLSLALWAACTSVSYTGLKVSTKLITDPGLIFTRTRTEVINGILIPARALFMFLFFKSLSFHFEPVNWIAGCTFGIYLSHTYPYLRDLLIFDIMKIDKVFLKSSFPFWLVVDVIAIFCAGILLEQLYNACSGLFGKAIQKYGSDHGGR